MEYKDVNIRFSELKKGDLVVARLLDSANWNQTGIVLAVYQGGHLYDAWCKEENMMPKENWCLTEHEVEEGTIQNLVRDYAFTGENVGDNISPVLD